MRAFRIGERVALTYLGRLQHLRGRAASNEGVVVAYTPGRVNRLRVKVRREGLKGANWYHRCFWRPLRSSR